MSSNTDPRKHPQGIEYVFVNGKKVVDNGKHTGERPGKILKRK
jgi:N-acyl-D-amino-acid deacylase